VLSEELREKIWEKVMQEGDSVRDVSASLGVEMSRVGAVVRLMEIEKEWERVVSLPFLSISTQLL
jgi:transposase